MFNFLLVRQAGERSVHREHVAKIGRIHFCDGAPDEQAPSTGRRSGWGLLRWPRLQAVRPSR